MWILVGYTEEPTKRWKVKGPSLVSFFFKISQLLKYWEIPEKDYEPCIELSGISTNDFTEKSDLNWKTIVLGKIRFWVLCLKIFPSFQLKLLISIQLKLFNRIFLCNQFPNTRFRKTQTKIIEAMIVLKHKNDTNTPECFQLWVSEVWPGLVQIRKEPVKRQQYSLISKYLSIMSYPTLFRQAKFGLTNLNENTNSQNYIIKDPVLLFYFRGNYFVKFQFYF